MWPFVKLLWAVVVMAQAVTNFTNQSRRLWPIFLQCMSRKAEFAYTVPQQAIAALRIAHRKFALTDGTGSTARRKRHADQPKAM